MYVQLMCVCTSVLYAMMTKGVWLVVSVQVIALTYS